MNKISLTINTFQEVNQKQIKPIAKARILSIPIQSHLQDPLQRMVFGIVEANRKNSSWLQNLRRIFSSLRIEVENISLHKESGLITLESTTLRSLDIRQLPEPAFYSHIPPRYFWHPSHTPNGNLLREDSDSLVEHVPNEAAILAYAQECLPLKGYLKKNVQGFLYVELPEAYVTELHPLLGEKDVEVPLYLFPQVIAALPREYEQRQELGGLKELGQNISFELVGCYCLKPRSWEEMERVWILTIKSPQLEALRESALLPSKILSHDFHIVIGARKAVKPAPETFRINVSCYAA